MKYLPYNQIRNHSHIPWKRIPLQNPNLARTTPTFDFVGTKTKSSKYICVCGSGLLGALGLPNYYKPQVDELQLKNKDILTNTLKRLSVFSQDAKIRDIACGYGFTIIACKVDDSPHTAFGFGINTYSQIGYHSSRPGYPLEIVATPSPIHIDNKADITKVSCGRSHSLLLSKDGSVYALGNNSLGQCGRSIIKDEIYFASKTVKKIKLLPENITSVECGQDHSFFLTGDGKLFSCGWGADGQTGLGHYEVVSKPTGIEGDIKGIKIKKISSFADTVLALDEDGNLFGWGNSEYSQLQILGANESNQFNLPRYLPLKNIPGKLIDVAAGGTSCMVLNDLGEVYVWGFGILGLGPDVDQVTKPKRIPASLFGKNVLNPDTKVEKIYASLTHLAAINNRGELYMWGKNRYGCLGFLHGKDQYFPWKVDTNLASIEQVALGVDHTCAIAVKDL